MRRKNQLKKIKNTSKLYTNYFFLSNYKLIYFYNFFFWNKLLNFSKSLSYFNLFLASQTMLKKQILSIQIFNTNLKFFLLNLFFFSFIRNFYYFQILLIFFFLINFFK